ncbi:arylsulfatase [Caballeronia humi]|uniref:Arylsulfatase n=2 Tax=Caballeronia humi TaxID=326474 RepID=A0A158H7Y1_9BURK|nr:arylsulfatase [Caballeronia humi]
MHMPKFKGRRTGGLLLAAALALTLGITGLSQANTAADAAKVQFKPLVSETTGRLGEILPLPQTEFEAMTEQDYAKVQAPAFHQVRPPKGAPNIVIVLLDQVAYADPQLFGGQIRMPTLDKLAKDGLTYTNFHVNALCSPSRMTLLTGRNQHLAGVSTVIDTATAYPANSGVRPRSVATVGEILHQWGYVTSYFGKNHEVPPYEGSVSGPFDRWPTQSGFDKFYGYIGGEQSSFYPNLIDGTTHVERPRNDPNYHFNTDMTNQAIAWLRGTQSLTPDRPFLMYYSSSGGHPPHTPRPDWLKKHLYAGEFDKGWDVMREEILARQKKLGIVPENTQLAKNPDYIKKWADLSPDAKKVYARQMEVYATLVESADAEVGRLVDTIEDLGQMDNTLFFYITGDNGGSSIGEINGVFNEWSALNGAPEDVAYLKKRIDAGEYGGPKSYPNYSIGWAAAGATPATWMIQMTHAGGNMAGMVVHYPKGIKAKSELRHQYAHLNDIVPTILDVIGVPEPKMVNGVKQVPMSGTSLKYTAADEKTERHVTQYNESSGNRSIYHEGWLAAVVHRAPWQHEAPQHDFEKDDWQLFHMAEDFGLANNVAAKYPEKLKEMKELFRQEAIRNKVFPLDDRGFQLLNPVEAGRPDLMFGRKSLTLYPGMRGMTENNFINTKAVSYTITADLDIPKEGAKGVIISQAGQNGGWSLYVKNGKTKYVYNWLSREKYVIESSEPLPTGRVKVTFDFAYDGGGLNKGATGTLSINGKKVGSGRIEKTQGAVYSLAGETADVGIDAPTPVTDDYPFYDNEFTGTIRTVRIDLK